MADQRTDKAKGRAKEAAGALTGNSSSCSSRVAGSLPPSRLLPALGEGVPHPPTVAEATLCTPSSRYP